MTGEAAVAAESSLAERLLPWFLLLPAAVLAWPGPGAPLERDPFPQLTGAGIAALLFVPAAVTLLFCRREGRVHGLGLPAIVWVCALLAGTVGAPTDSFEARRALVLTAACATAFLGGGQLVGGARRRFDQGLCLLAIVWLGTALASAFLRRGHLAGVLGDTGTLSQAALPGAVIGAWYLATRNRTRRVLGLVTTLLFIAHAGLTPVVAGGLALTVALVGSVFLSGVAARHERTRRRLGFLASFGVFAMIALPGLELVGRSDPPGAAEAEVARAPDRTSHLGGFEVRARIWSRVPSLVRAHPLLGVGPGQFQAEFPPYRDPREIEISRHGVCSDATTVVEHPHNDWLAGVTDLGVLAGLLWLAFGGLTLRAAVHALRAEDVESCAMGAAVVALLVNTLFHGVLGFNPAAAPIAFVLFGAVHARDGRLFASIQARLAVPAVALAALAAAVAARPLVAHGRAMSRYAETARRIDAMSVRGADSPGWRTAMLEAATEAKAAAQSALGAAGDSAPARMLVARLAESDARPEAWTSVLDVRPHSVEALENLAAAHARSGDVARARALWERAQELSPTQPRILRNLARLELFEGGTARGLELVEALRSNGCLDPRWHEGIGIELVLDGGWRAGAVLLLEADPSELAPESLYAGSREAFERGEDRRGSALRCLAHLFWARDQAAAGDHATAIRSYRQALAPTYQVRPEGAVAIRVELAAAECLAGLAEDARLELSGLEFEDRIWSELPDWSRDVLTEERLYGDASREP